MELACQRDGATRAQGDVAELRRLDIQRHSVEGTSVGVRNESIASARRESSAGFT